MTPNFVGHVDHVHYTRHEEKQRKLFHHESDNGILNTTLYILILYLHRE